MMLIRLSLFSYKQWGFLEALEHGNHLIRLGFLKNNSCVGLKMD